jgi:hypothetical protein
MAVAECSLAELMEDPLVRLVMKSDGVDRCELELLFERVGRGRLWTDWHHSNPAWRACGRAEPAQCLPC